MAKHAFGRHSPRLLAPRVYATVSAALLSLVGTISTSDAATSTAAIDILAALRPDPSGLTEAAVIERAGNLAADVISASADKAKVQRRADVAWLGFSPRVDLRAGYTRLSEVDLPPFEIQGMVVDSPFPQVLDNFSFRASLAVPVSDYFLTVIHAYGATLVANDVGRYQLRAAREASAMRGVEAYSNVARARAFLTVAGNALRVLEAYEVDVLRLEAAGLALRADLLQVRAEKANALVDLERAKGNLRVAEFTLRTILHAKADENMAHAEDLFGDRPDAAPNEQAVLQAALDVRPEVRSLRKLVEIQQNLVAFNHGSRFPRVNLHANADIANPNPRVFPQTQEFRSTWDVGLSLAWSPNDYVRATTAQLEAEQDTVKAHADLAKIENAIAIEVSNALATYRAARGSIGAAAEALDASVASFEERSALLRSGEATSREVLDAQSNLSVAQLQLVNAHLDARLAEARLRRATGGLTEGAGEQP